MEILGMDFMFSKPLMCVVASLLDLLKRPTFNTFLENGDIQEANVQQTRLSMRIKSCFE